MHKLKNSVGRDERISKRTNVRPNRMKFSVDWGSRCAALFGVVLSVGWKSNDVKNRTRAQQIKPINEKFQGVFSALLYALEKYHRMNPSKESKFCVNTLAFLYSHGMNVYSHLIGGCEERRWNKRESNRCISSDNDSKSEKLITDVNACVHTNKITMDTRSATSRHAEQWTECKKKKKKICAWPLSCCFRGTFALFAPNIKNLK